MRVSEWCTWGKWRDLRWNADYSISHELKAIGDHKINFLQPQILAARGKNKSGKMIWRVMQIRFQTRSTTIKTFWLSEGARIKRKYFSAFREMARAIFWMVQNAIKMKLHFLKLDSSVLLAIFSSKYFCKKNFFAPSLASNTFLSPFCEIKKMFC